MPQQGIIVTPPEEGKKGRKKAQISVQKMKW
jgi:hypothetical protein